MAEFPRISHKKVVVTGGAGFIGSNICEDLLNYNNHVVCLDNLSTGFKENILPLMDHPSFEFIEGDIRDLDTCKRAVIGADIVLHQAALGSVPRSIHDPITTNSVNIDGFLNMLIAARDEGIKRFVYAASSSTYGDSKELPKVEENIGSPLSPYAVTKYVNELYAKVFGLNYGMELIGLRYFNVFGRRQSPSGAYAAVIPKFVEAFIRKEAPVINGDGTFSRDFTYVDNVIQMNHLAATTENPAAIGEVFNTACGEQMSLNDLAGNLKSLLSFYDEDISVLEVIHGPERKGDIPHSLASINKAQRLLDYRPEFSVSDGLKEAIDWYWTHLS